MRPRAILTLTAGVLIAGVTVYQVDQKMRLQQNAPTGAQASIAPIELTRIVLADKEFPYGADIRPEYLVEVDWPSASIPDESFRSIDGKARLNPGVESVSGTDLFSLRATLGRWKGAPGNSSWTIAQRSDAVELRRELATLDDVIPLDGLRFELPADDPVILSKRWVIFEGHDGNKAYWYSQGPKDIFRDRPPW